jgi:hypothetical protein
MECVVDVRSEDLQLCVVLDACFVAEISKRKRLLSASDATVSVQSVQAMAVLGH